MKKEIGKEYPPQNENFYIDQMVMELKKQMDELFPRGTEMLRQAETKMHGCLKGTFTILHNLDPQYKVGIFAEPKSYDAIIRFSNAATGKKKDSAKDQRGIAVKLLGVDGEKLKYDEHPEKTQDLIGLNYETFVSKSVREFSGVIKAFTSGKLSLILFILNPLHWRLMLRVAKANSTVGSLVEQNYYSTTAYQFGSDRAIKFMFRSTLNYNTPPPKKKDPDFLRHQLIAYLENADIQFDFMVQFQEDADKMPVEDPTVKWTSPYIKLATLHIPKQVFDTEENREFAEKLSFNPWHSLPVHRPLGGLNRARLAIYSTLSRYRNKSNGYKTQEPVYFTSEVNEK